MAPKIFLLEFFLALAIPVAVHGQKGDSITAGQSLRDGETLVSAQKVFELGFFSPSNSNFRYLGIWYKNIPPGSSTKVWVANKEKPVTSADGVLNLTSGGNLVLYGGGILLWSKGAIGMTNPILQLLDTGNLKLMQSDSPRIMWQSFDEPYDTLLPEMKLGIYLGTYLDRYLTSWKSESDPSPGNFTYKMNTSGVPQMNLRKGDKIIYRSGPWNGNGYSGRPEMQTDRNFKFDFTWDRDDVYYSFQDLNNSFFLSRVILRSNGVVERFVWKRLEPNWMSYWTIPKDACDFYKTCGPNTVCNGTSVPCQCLKGFISKDESAWKLKDFTSGCVRRTKLNCTATDGFCEVKQVKLPDTSQAIRSNMTRDECEAWCLRNCSCLAYSVIFQGSMCITWFSDLVDIRAFVEGGDTMYLRLATSDQDFPSCLVKENKSFLVIVIPMVVGLVAVVFILVSAYLILKRRNGGRRPAAGSTDGNQQSPGPITTSSRDNSSSNAGQERDSSNISGGEINSSTRAGTGGSSTTSEAPRDNAVGGFPSFTLSAIVAATSNFSIKLGEGAFGIVYKGQLDGKWIAVKRLKDLPRRPLEFETELRLIAKLRHVNLVRLLGYCIEGNERILILEFMENRSLDTFYEERSRRTLLDWNTRLDIIIGIAKGLQYLHEDCDDKVVHRDLKLSNILLDGRMKPKISDFGISRIFGGDEVKERATTRPMGTVGYMAPEYAYNGIFSFKSDAFSFGVLVLEILSGKKNLGIDSVGNRTDLIGYAYSLWPEGCLRILDDALNLSYSPIQVKRCIQVGLLCVQENSEDRPKMSEVVMMLYNQDVQLKSPNPPRQMMTSVQVDFSSCGEITSLTSDQSSREFQHWKQLVLPNPME